MRGKFALAIIILLFPILSSYNRFDSELNYEVKNKFVNLSSKADYYLLFKNQPTYIDLKLFKGDKAFKVSANCDNKALINNLVNEESNRISLINKSVKGIHFEKANNTESRVVLILGNNSETKRLILNLSTEKDISISYIN